MRASIFILLAVTLISAFSRHICQTDHPVMLGSEVADCCAKHQEGRSEPCHDSHETSANHSPCCSVFFLAEGISVTPSVVIVPATRELQPIFEGLEQPVPKRPPIA